MQQVLQTLKRHILLGTIRMAVASGPARDAARSKGADAGAAAGAVAFIFAAEASKSGLRMMPSLTPRTTDWRPSSGGAATALPATSTLSKPCARSRSCQLLRLISGEPACRNAINIQLSQRYLSRVSRDDPIPVGQVQIFHRSNPPHE